MYGKLTVVQVLDRSSSLVFISVRGVHTPNLLPKEPGVTEMEGEHERQQAEIPGSETESLAMLSVESCFSPRSLDPLLILQNGDGDDNRRDSVRTQEIMYQSAKPWMCLVTVTCSTCRISPSLTFPKGLTRKVH